MKSARSKRISENMIIFFCVCDVEKLTDLVERKNLKNYHFLDRTYLNDSAQY